MENRIFKPSAMEEIVIFMIIIIIILLLLLLLLLFKYFFVRIHHDENHMSSCIYLKTFTSNTFSILLKRVFLSMPYSM